jgi:hypothetical protein
MTRFFRAPLAARCSVVERHVGRCSGLPVSADGAGILKKCRRANFFSLFGANQFFMIFLISFKRCYDDAWKH